MSARKVKVRSFRVIDGIDPWEDLASQLDALEKTARKPPSSPEAIGDDTVTTESTADAKAKFLDDAAERIQKAVSAARKLGDKERQVAADQAARAIERARDLQRALVAPGVAVAYGAADKLNAAEEAAKKLVPWYAAIGVVTWIVVVAGVYLIYETQKKGGPRAARAIMSRGASEVRR
jgi:hypothetical protein